MAAGIEIYNSNNILQITEQYKNLAYLGKQTITATAKINRIQTNPDELIAYRVSSPSTDKIRVASTYRLSDGEMCFFISMPFGTSLPSTSTIELYRFSFTPNAAGGQNGLEVYNAAGEIVFNSNYKYMRVLGHSSGILADINNMPYDTVLSETIHSSNLKTAVLVGTRYSSMYWAEYGNPDHPSFVDFYFQSQAFEFATNKVISYYNFDYSVSAPPSQVSFPDAGNYSSTWNFLVLDVTNY